MPNLQDSFEHFSLTSADNNRGSFPRGVDGANIANKLDEVSQDTQAVVKDLGELTIGLHGTVTTGWTAPRTNLHTLDSGSYWFASTAVGNPTAQTNPKITSLDNPAAGKITVSRVSRQNVVVGRLQEVVIPSSREKFWRFKTADSVFVNEDKWFKQVPGAKEIIESMMGDDSVIARVIKAKNVEAGHLEDHILEERHLPTETSVGSDGTVEIIDGSLIKKGTASPEILTAITYPKTYYFGFGGGSHFNFTNPTVTLPLGIKKIKVRANMNDSPRTDAVLSIKDGATVLWRLYPDDNEKTSNVVPGGLSGPFYGSTGWNGYTHYMLWDGDDAALLSAFEGKTLSAEVLGAEQGGVIFEVDVWATGEAYEAAE